MSHAHEIPVPDPRRPVPKAGETWYVAPNPDSKTVIKVHVIDVTPRTAYLQELHEDGTRIHSDKKRWLRSAISFVERVEPPEPTRTGGFDPGVATATTAPSAVAPERGFVPGGVRWSPLYHWPLYHGRGDDPLFPVVYGNRVVYYDKNGVPRKETW